MNALKTAALLGLLSSVLIVGGGAVAGKSGLQMGLILALGMNFFSYFFSEKMALAATRAQRVSETEHPEIFAKIGPMTKRLADRMGLPMPKLWVMPEMTPNAFATGRNPSHSSVAVTSGLLQLMSTDEVEGVIAHELGHIKNRDILISSVAGTIASAITYLAHFSMFFGGRHSDEEGGSPAGGLLLLILGPLAAGLIQMAISRTREYSADEAAARAIGSPHPLANALGKLEGYGKQIPMEVSPARSHMYIMKPFGGGAMSKLFSTHPPTQERIARLRSLQF